MVDIQRHCSPEFYNLPIGYELLVDGRLMRPFYRAWYPSGLSALTVARAVRAGLVGLYRIRGYRFDYLAKDELMQLAQCIKSGAVQLNNTERYAPDHELRRTVIERDKMFCQYCGKDLAGLTPYIDHIVPFLRGGSTRLANLVTACRRCNTRKGNRTPEEAGMRLLPIGVS